MLQYKHLIGKDFSWTDQHCYTLMRQFYWDNFQVELLDVACPHEWWSQGMDLYGQLYHDAGFVALSCHPRDYKPGDLIMMAYNSPVANHLGVLLENGKMLHHIVGGLSAEDPYSSGGFWRSLTVGVLRHRDVDYNPTIEKVDLWSVLPANVRSSLDHQIADLEAQGLSRGN